MRPTKAGYIRRQRDGTKIFEHVMVAEAVLGRPLPAGAVVHHVDEDRTNNAPCNLVICQDRRYHALLHRRMRAYHATGDPQSLKCVFCGYWASPQRVGFYRTPRGQGYHRSCKNTDQNARYAKRAAACEGI